MIDVRRIMLVPSAALLLSACFAFSAFAADAPADGVWRFNFAPAGAPDVESFVTVSGKTLYDKDAGYGWTDARGELELGKFEGDGVKLWESRANLNMICRLSPDALARSYATGPATFALDLPPGRYEVWVLSGDAGLLECIPHEPYRILVEDAVAYSFHMTPDDFYRRFENPAVEDALTPSGVWERCVAPRFRWSAVTVDVADGQLSVRVDSPRRDLTLFNFVGDYAITETRGGPKVRYAGALNALVVMKAGRDAVAGLQVIDRVDAWRREDFAKRFPMVAAEPDTKVNWSAEAARRGYALFVPNIIEPARPQARAEADVRALSFRATPGEYLPITFALCPFKDLGVTELRVSQFAAGGRTWGRIQPGVVRYEARPSGPARKDIISWAPAPAMIVAADRWRIAAGVARQFWLTYHVPEDMPPGRYEGAVTLMPEHGEPATITLALEVLPFRLARPTDLAVGMTYFSPIEYSYYGEDRFWKRMEAEFADLRAHNMTSVQYTGIRMDDFERLDRAFALYRKSGFERPVNLLESYGAMCRIRREGVAWETEEFHVKYVQFVRRFVEEAKRRNWPPIVIDFGDEFTNSAIEEFGAKLAKNLKAIPGIVTGTDSNGYKEVSLMAPEVDIVAFNDGWDGPKGVNRGKNLLKKDTVDLVKKAGATPWLVNVGKDRFSNGYWLWKMARLGIRGKMEWMYRAYNGMPFDSFDAQPMRGDVVYPGPDGGVTPSPEYEWIRIGLDDLAYLNTLEQALEAARKDPAKQAAVARADAFLKRLDGTIEDEMKKYRDPGTKAQYVWPAARYDEVRAETIDLILALR